MIELTFLEFQQQRYEKQPFCLYVMKNGNADALYIGISTKDVWERWFGFGGHLTWDGEIKYGESPIGMKIESHLPDSLGWKIQLWTLKDCLEFCREELPADTSAITIHDIEQIMIRILSPVLNGTYNLNPDRDSTPTSKRETERKNRIDQAYKEIFDKKQP